MEKLILTILLYSILSFCSVLSAAQSLEIDNPKSKDPFLAEMFAQVDESNCGEPEGDGLMFSCDHRNEPVVVVEPGESLQLNCSVSGSRNMAINWKKNGKTVATGPVRPRRNNKRPFLRTEVLNYRIGCVTPKDAGVYMCIAQADGVTIRRKTTVFVLADDNAAESATISKCQTSAKEAPKVYAFTDTIFDNPGATARLTCRASGSPAPAITWYQRQTDMSFAKIEHQNGFSFAKNGDLLLPPLSLEPIHFAEYKCEAKNEVGEDSVTTYIQVMPDSEMEELTALAPSRQAESPVSADMILANDEDVEDVGDLLNLRKRKRNRRQLFWTAVSENNDADTDAEAEAEADADDEQQQQRHAVRLSPSAARRYLDELLVNNQ